MPISQFVEQASRDGIAALGIGERKQNGVIGGLTLLGAMQRIKPRLELLAPSAAEAWSSVISSQRRMNA